ncbi:MAG: hypothetical protein QOJ64_3662 [Acidobacteriota bacterium]|nr:hypothetical protein [Acidobacteriota bacterium]
MIFQNFPDPINPVNPVRISPNLSLDGQRDRVTSA